MAIKKRKGGTKASSQQQWQGFFVFVIWDRASACTPVIPAVSYLPTGLAGCSVGPGISCGARKLARTPRVTKKKREKNRRIMGIMTITSFEA